MSYNQKCEELAEHFIGSRISAELRARLAQHIQDAVETWIESERDDLAGALNPTKQ